MSRTREMVYAVIGAGDLAFEKARSLRKVADPEVFGDLVGRGREISGRIRRSAPTKNAVDRTRTARSQAKAAATSVRKAVAANATAAKSAAQKLAG